MRRFILPLCLLLSASLGAQVLDRPVAIVRLTETVNIGLRQLESQIGVFEQQIGRSLGELERQQILDALINDALLLQAATRGGIRVTQVEIQNYLTLQRQQWSQLVGAPLTDAQFRSQVEAQTGAPWSEFVSDITDELIKLKYVRQQRSEIFQAATTVSQSEIEDLYDERATSFTNPAMVSFRHVFVDLRGKSDDERAEARSLLTRLRRNIQNGSQSFVEIERDALDDARYSADNFGYVLRNDPRSQQLLGRSFINELFNLDIGDTGGVLESNVALHIVLITDKRSPRILELDDPVLPGQSVTVREQIRNLLASQKEQEALALAVDDVVSVLRNEAEITIFEHNLPW